MSHGAGDVEELDYLVEDLPIMYAVTRDDEDGPVVAGCNRQFASSLGYEREALVGRPFADVFTPRSAAALERGGFERAMADEFETARRELVRADGTVLQTRMRAVPRTDADGEVVGATALFVDVTTRERRRRQAAVLNRLLRHNLRNDMTVVLSHASLLVDALDGRELDSAKRIFRTAQRWDRLIEKVQRIRRVLSPESEWSRTDLAAVLERIETELDDAYPPATIRVLRPAAGAATVRPEIELALTELCENAINHAAADDPEVVVTVGIPPTEPWVKLTVTDDGPPIPDSELVPFRDDETTPLLHGTGLGLWMVRLALDCVGGDVEVVENDADGTAITIRYPRA